MLKLKEKLYAIRYTLYAKSGFTLIELLVVVSIIGMLTALILVNFNAARERARDTQRKSDLNQIKRALRMYYNDYDGYPEHSGSAIAGCGDDGDAACTWGGLWSAGSAGMVYMKVLPQDPNPDNDYSYRQDTPDDQDFCVWAELENKSDGDIVDSKANCASVCSFGANDYFYVVCAD